MSDRTVVRTLMCRDHEAARFSYDLTVRDVAGKVRVIDPVYLPQGCLDESGPFSGKRLSRRLSNRAVRATRPGTAPVLRRPGLEHPGELLTAGFGPVALRPVLAAPRWWCFVEMGFRQFLLERVLVRLGRGARPARPGFLIARSRRP